LYSEILKRHAATQEHPNISILLPAAECGSWIFHVSWLRPFYLRILI
jgi:hypothetical protein